MYFDFAGRLKVVHHLLSSTAIIGTHLARNIGNKKSLAGWSTTNFVFTCFVRSEIRNRILPFPYIHLLYWNILKNLQKFKSGLSDFHYSWKVMSFLQCFCDGWAMYSSYNSYFLCDSHVSYKMTSYFSLSWTFLYASSWVLLNKLLYRRQFTHFHIFYVIASIIYFPCLLRLFVFPEMCQ